MFGATYIYMASWVFTGEVITRRIRQAYLKSVLRQDIAYFDLVGAGEVTTRIQSDIQLIQEGISDKLPISVMFIATFIAGFIVAYIKSWKLSLAMSSILPCVVLAGAAMNVLITRYQRVELLYVAQAATIAEEAMSTVRTAKAFGIENKLVDLYDESNRETTSLGKRKAVVHGIGLGIFFFVIYASYALAFYFGSKLIASGEIPSGTVMTVVFSIFIGAFSLAMLAPNMTAYSYATSAAAKVFETIDRVPSIDSSDPSGKQPESCTGHVELRNVGFRYPSRPNIDVIRDLSLTIEAGKTTALVGASGSGKSTIVSLLERYYDASEGHVLLDNVDVRDLNIKWLRSQIGFVAQEPVLFSSTIAENIGHGLLYTKHEHASPEERMALIVAAAEKANAKTFIEQLPDSYQTIVGERGFLLSGGQKQRIAIARAIVGSPTILLLDEATSALDTQSEGVVQEALDKAAQGRTTITIAHRLSTIKNADKIVVMGKGIILEQGTHNELLAKPDGAYAGLVHAQEIRGRDVIDSVVDDELDEEKLTSMGGTLDKVASLKGEKAEMPAGMSRMLSKKSVTSMLAKRGEDLEKGQTGKRRSLFYLLYRLALINKDKIWTLYVPGVICAVGSGAVYPVFSILFGIVLNTYSLCSAEEEGGCPEPARSQMRSSSNTDALYFFIMSLVATVVIIIQNGFLVLAASILMERLRRASLKALLRSDVSFFDRDGNSSGSLTASLADNSQKINGLVGVTMGTLIQSLSTLLIGWIIALAYGWRLALPLIATSPLTLSAGYVRLKLVVLRDEKVKKAHEGAAMRACEAASSIRTVASLCREDDCLASYRQALDKPARIVWKTAFYGNILYAVSQALAFPTIALGFWYGSNLLLDGHLGSGQKASGHFFTVLTATIFASLQAGNAFSFAPDVSQAHGAANESIKLLDSVPDIDAESEEGIIMNDCEGHVELRGVHFRYPTRPSVPVLRGLDFKVEPGTFVALVGGSGCGKSTTIQLIERFYDVMAGQVFIDGRDIREYNVKSLRRHIALVAQEPTLYDGTIGWNIALGAFEDAERVTEQQLIRAARQANILSFVEGLPDGFDTHVGSKGAQLSGGQKQRIAIARALVRDPKILLLDEATSALDSQSEHVVQEALDKAAKGRTTIAIAHRLSTVSRADEIFCLKDGVVSERGDHASLMASGQLYADLVRMQGLHAGQ